MATSILFLFAGPPRAPLPPAGQLAQLQGRQPAACSRNDYAAGSRLEAIIAASAPPALPARHRCAAASQRAAPPLAWGARGPIWKRSSTRAPVLVLLHLHLL
eukprot:9488154-Pyramimonas_sp.AAC.2